MSCCVDAARLLLGAEKAESVAGRKEVVQDRRDRGAVFGAALPGGCWCCGAVGCVWEQPRHLTGGPWASPAPWPWCSASARQKCSNLISISQCWNFCVEPSLSFALWAVLGLEGEGWSGGPSPTCGSCQMCRLVSGCLPGRGGGWRADGGEITPPRHSDKDDPALPLIKRLILEFEIGI